MNTQDRARTMLTVRVAAETAGTSPSLVYQWVKEKRLAVYRLGGKGKRGKIAIDAAEFGAFLESLKVGADADRSPATPALRLKNLTL